MKGAMPDSTLVYALPMRPYGTHGVDTRLPKWQGEGQRSKHSVWRDAHQLHIFEQIFQGIWHGNTLLGYETFTFYGVIDSGDVYLSLRLF